MHNVRKCAPKGMIIHNSEFPQYGEPYHANLHIVLDI